MILNSTVAMVHNLLTENQIKIINKELRIPQSKRKIIVQLHFKLKCEKKRNRIFLGWKIYNLLPDELKTLNLKKIKKKIKEVWIAEPPT